MEAIYFILLVAFAILYFVLFFKVWRMTNEVHLLKEKMDRPPRHTIIREIYKGNPNIKDVLFDGLWESLYDCHKAEDLSFTATIKAYKELYERAGVPFPEKVENIKGEQDYLKYLNNTL